MLIITSHVKTPFRIAVTKNKGISKDAGKFKLLHVVREHAKSWNYGKQYKKSSKLKIEPSYDPAIHFWVYIQKNGNQGFEETCKFESSQELWKRRKSFR